MSCLLRVILFAGVFVFSSLVFAGKTCHLSSVPEIFSAISSEHPSVKLQHRENSFYQSKIDSVAQSPNPVFNTTIIQGNSASEEAYGIQYVWETAGKRQNRIELAKSTLRKQLTRGKITLERAQRETFILLYEANQIQELLALYRESLGQFKEMRSRIARKKIFHQKSWFNNICSILKLINILYLFQNLKIN